ncbi:hypothetical protein TNIN_133071 [Trichonephila inaurata madagascariensis]|uniref:Uncharacterized protein n=1 Tax=Trichonephila inaurata madagascariensis TaxID=2747483 RepID=A0A8X7CA52_9ARAC|nr:hypothetical protein TNIN_133071 [Trichonephila inaurata madagascariensis]
MLINLAIKDWDTQEFLIHFQNVIIQNVVESVLFERRVSKCYVAEISYDEKHEEDEWSHIVYQNSEFCQMVRRNWMFRGSTMKCPDGG